MADEETFMTNEEIQASKPENKFKLFCEKLATGIMEICQDEEMEEFAKDPQFQSMLAHALLDISSTSAVMHGKSRQWYEKTARKCFEKSQLAISQMVRMKNPQLPQEPVSPSSTLHKKSKRLSPLQARIAHKRQRMG